MGHNHHSHTVGKKAYGKAFTVGIILNVVYVVVEAFYGFTVNSSALLADAGHNFSDVISLILAWGAIWVASRPPTEHFTYGFRKNTILASFINGFLIIAASGFILYDAIYKIENPAPVPGNTLMIVAAIGLVVNAGTAYMFFDKQEDDLNIKGAFLHMIADAAVTAGVLIAGLVIKYTGAYWIDPVLSFLIVGVIIYSTWELLVDSARLAMDAVPKDVDINEIKAFLQGVDNVEGVHDLHIWALSTTENALTCHLVIPSEHDDQFLFDIREKLKHKFNIDHSTIQVEKTFEDEQYCKVDTD